jgi:hypothetical protein
MSLGTLLRFASAQLSMLDPHMVALCCRSSNLPGNFHAQIMAVACATIQQRDEASIHATARSAT